MKITFKTVITVLFIVIAQFSNAQLISKSDYVVNNNNDTLLGEIKFAYGLTNPKEIKFSKDSKEINYKTADLLSFYQVSKNILYRRFVINVSNFPIDEAVELNTNSKMDTLTEWVEVLIDKKIGLGRFLNLNRAYFYALTNQNAVELIYGRGQDANRTSIKEEIKYKKTLFGLFNNNDNSTEILNKLNLLEYTETDLTKFYYAVSKTKKESSLKPIHHLTVGVGLSTFINESYGNNQYINSSVNFKTNNSLNVRIGHQLISNKKSRLVINSALEFLSINTSAIKYSNGLTNDVKYFITGNNFNFNSALNYNLIQTNSNVKIGIGVGVNLSFLTGMNERSEEFFSGTLFTFQNFFNYKKTELHPIYCINADFKRFSLLLSYRTIRQLFNYQVGNLQKSIATLTVNYKIL